MKTRSFINISTLEVFFRENATVEAVECSMKG